MTEELPEYLYHYTDINGLYGIWGDEALRLTDWRFLNDVHEPTFGMGHVESAIAQFPERLLATGESKEEINRSLKQFQQMIRSVKDYWSSTDGYMHVGCLTSAPDLLSQWRGYAVDGYCIEFDVARLQDHWANPETLEPLRKYHKKAPYPKQLGKVRLDQVAYVGNELDNADSIRKLLDDAFGRWREASVSATREDEWLHDSMLVMISLGDQLIEAAAFRKNSAFAEEREYRVSYSPSSPSLFTPGRYGLVPRFELPIPREAITSVTVGPNRDTELQVSSLETFFEINQFGEETGYEHPPFRLRRVAVKKSKIPLR